MKKSFVILACAVLPMFSALAQEAHEPLYDYAKVVHVAVGGVEVGKIADAANMPPSIWEGTQETHEEECTGDTTATIKKNGRSLYFVFDGFPEKSDGDSRVAQVNNFLASKTTDNKKSPLKVSLNHFTWTDMAAMTDRVEIDGRVISPKMTFAEFKALYPKSAMHGDADTDDTGKPNGIMGYYVKIGSDPLETTGFVYFGFRDGKLVRLTVGNGEDDC